MTLKRIGHKIDPQRNNGQSREHTSMIEINNLSFGYDKDVLFQQMDLGLEPGNIYGLLGINGAGKSTLLKLMTGLLFPDSGSISSLGYDPSRRDPEFRGTEPRQYHRPAIRVQHGCFLSQFFPRTFRTLSARIRYTAKPQADPVILWAEEKISALVRPGLGI